MQTTRLDVGQRAQFGQFVKTWVLLTPFLPIYTILIFAFYGKNPPAVIDLGIPKEYGFSVAFGVIFLIYFLIFLVVFKKSKKKIKPTTAYRSTEKVFDFDNPQSILESVVLYQDYCSKNIIKKDLRQDNNCNYLLFNTFKKAGWLKTTEEDVILRTDVKNPIYQTICYGALEGTLNSIVEAESILRKNNNVEFSFKKQDELFKENGDYKIYHIHVIKDYAVELKRTLNKSVDELRTWKFKDWQEKESLAKFGEIHAKKMYENYVNFNNENVIDYVEREVQKKYFKNSKKMIAAGLKALLICFGNVALLAICCAHLTGIDLSFQQHLLLAAEYVTLALFSLYIVFLNEEASEQLNPDGEQIYNKIAGLEYFIRDFTSIEDPLDEQITQMIWGDFIFFTAVFDLNTDVYEFAKKLGIEYKEEEIFDYFQPADFEKFSSTNHIICNGITCLYRPENRFFYRTGTFDVNRDDTQKVGSLEYLDKQEKAGLR